MREVTDMIIKTKLMLSTILIIGVLTTGCAQDSQNQTAGTVVGAVAGGLLGSTIGSGSGKTAATIGGAAVGGLVGGAVGKNMDDNQKKK